MMSDVRLSCDAYYHSIILKLTLKLIVIVKGGVLPHNQSAESKVTNQQITQHPPALVMLSAAAPRSIKQSSSRVFV